ncbi:MAG: GIY-YIG nuclease family protein [bacterium]|nr:GIY-YIG nuclease family protein [bacterium]
MAYVYIIKSLKNNRYYIGSTNNFEKRFLQHQKGNVISTRSNRPYKVMLVQEFVTITLAKQIEYKLKKLKRKDYIDKIIKEQYIKLRIE